jgi:hypothetical protein
MEHGQLQRAVRYHAEWAIPCAILAALLCWCLIAAAKLELSIAAVLAGGTLIAPHNTVSDGGLFLPLLFWSQQSPYRIVRASAIFVVTSFYVFLPSGTLQIIVLLLLGAAAGQLRRVPASAMPSSPAHPDAAPRSAAPA